MQVGNVANDLGFEGCTSFSNIFEVAAFALKLALASWEMQPLAFAVEQKILDLIGIVFTVFFLALL